MPMRTKRMIQTAEMIDPGGVNQGFSRVIYQVVTDLAVNCEPMTPASRHIAMHKISLANSLNFMKFIRHSLPFQRGWILKSPIFFGLYCIYLFLFTVLL